MTQQPPSQPHDAPDQPAAAGTPAAPPQRPLWQKIVGLRRRQGRIPFRLTLWGWALWLGVIGLCSMGGFAEYTMQPDFCRSCHIMEPYYQAWHESTHKNVPCADCHFEPGWQNTIKGKWQASNQAVSYATNMYGSKPHADIRDTSCLRSGCHEKRLLEGKIAWTIKTQRGDDLTINFDHTPHLEGLRRGKQLRCVSCHSQMVQGKHIVVTLDTCFLCHFKNLEHGRNEQTISGCKACHDAPKNQIRLATGLFNHNSYLQRGVTCENCHSDAIRGNGSVARQVCWNCHNEPAKLARFGETSLMHKSHISDHKVECSNCHLQIEHNLTAGRPQGVALSREAHQLDNAGGACGECHEMTHDSSLALYSGTGGRGVPPMPSAMYLAQVDCIACHSQPTADAPQATDAPTLAKAGDPAAPQAGPAVALAARDDVADPALGDTAAKAALLAALADAAPASQPAPGGSASAVPLVPQLPAQTFTASEKSCRYCHGEQYSDRLDQWRQALLRDQARAQQACTLAADTLAKAGELDAVEALRLQNLLSDARHNVNLVRNGHGEHNVTYATALLSVALDNCRQILTALGQAPLATPAPAAAAAAQESKPVPAAPAAAPKAQP